jgi:hypothetical protein
MKIPFVGPSYQARSLSVDAQRAVNCYLEIDQSGGKPLALYGTPGLELQTTVGAGPHRGSLTLDGVCIIVSGSKVYAVSSTFAALELGNLATGSGMVGMASNGSEVLIVDGIDGYLATKTSVAAISDVDFPRGVTSCGYVDGWFLVGGDGSGRFYINETPGTGSAWNGLDFASAERRPDPVARLITDHAEVWLVGTQTTEVYVNTGAADFPFERNGSIFIEVGTPAVAYAMQWDGHAWYVLHFSTSNHTWFFDASTGQWCEWLYRNPATNEENRHRAHTHVYFAGKHLVGDWEDGKLYSLEEETFTDNGDPIVRLRATQEMDSEGELVFYEELIVDMETGVGTESGQGSEPLLMLRYSNDSGRTWSNQKTRPIGVVGNYGARVKFGPTGAGRNRVWEISMSDPVKFVVMGASVRAAKGT